MDINTLTELLLREARAAGAVNLPEAPVLSGQLASNREIAAICQEKLEHDQDVRERYSRLLLTLTRLIQRPPDSPVGQALASLKDTLAPDADLEDIERISNIITNAVIQEQLGGDDASVDSGDPEAMSGADLIGLVKSAYLSLLTELDVDLNPEYRQGVVDLRKRINMEETPVGYMRLRPELEKIIRDYASNLFEGQSRAEQFIAEVVSHLAELEQFLLDSLGHLRTTHASNEKFANQLAEEVREAVTTIREGGSLDKLRQAVMSKLKNMNSLIMEKMSHDKTLIRGAKKSLDEFQQHFSGFQDDVARV